MFNFEQLRGAFPEYAKDIKLNLSSVLQPSPMMTEAQLWGCALTCAIVSNSETLRTAIASTAIGKLSDKEMNAAKTAAALMSMNNVYYRFLDLVGDESYSKQPAQLRMNGIANHGIDTKDFELWSLAASAINACGYCISSHEKKLIAEGVTQDTIRHAVRIAAVIKAAAVVIESENMVAQSSVASAA